MGAIFLEDPLYVLILLLGILDFLLTCVGAIEVQKLAKVLILRIRVLVSLVSLQEGRICANLLKNIDPVYVIWILPRIWSLLICLENLVLQGVTSSAEPSLSRGSRAADAPSASRLDHDISGRYV